MRRTRASLTSFRKKASTKLPETFDVGHWLSFTHHDILVRLLEGGHQVDAFREAVPLNSRKEAPAHDDGPAILAFLGSKGAVGQRERFLRKAVFSAVLSDSLHFIFEALEASRKAKLTVSFALLRKPLQEGLLVLEAMAVDRDAFVRDFETQLRRLQPGTAGGVPQHATRIGRVLEAIGQSSLYDAQYLAELRYDKGCDDSFDKVFSPAIHLITTREAIATELCNFNFVFSGHEERLTQWSFLYARLPYILSYMRHVAEHVFSEYIATEPAYLADMEQRTCAGAVLWGRTISEHYRSAAIDNYLKEAASRLNSPRPMSVVHDRELERIAASGGNLGDSRLRAGLRRAVAKLS